MVVDNTRILAAQRNLCMYRRILDSYVEPKAREAIEQLVRETEGELEAAEAKEQVKAINDADELIRRAQRWRLKAQEYRATADIVQNHLARQSYLRLAQDYDQLADGVEASVSRRKRQRDARSS